MDKSVSCKANRGVRSRRTFDLLLRLTTGGDVQATDELSKVNYVIFVLVVDTENIVGKFLHVSEWEDLLVYLDEPGPVEFTRGTLFEEGLVAAV